MSAAAGDAELRNQRRADRDERKRQRAAQDSSKTGTGQKKDRTPAKDEKKKRKNDFSSTNGGTHMKPPSGAKRYDKVNIVEKNEATEKENKGKQQNEGEKGTATQRKLGSKFLDNLSKFEGSAASGEARKERSPFVRSSSAMQDKGKSDPATFRRSYRPSRSTPTIEDPTILVRRSLRKERVLDSIAKLEKGGLRKQPPSPTNDRKISSRPSSAGSCKTISSDSGSSTSSTKASTSRAQQALERHKNRMRKVSQNAAISPVKPSSPASKSRSFSSADTPTKTPTKSRLRNKDKSLTKTPTTDEPRTRKISVTKTPSQDDDDVVEITTVTEIVTPTKEKMDVIIKEKAKTEEEVTELIESSGGPEYEPGDPRPLSVGDAVTMFSAEEISPTTPEQKPAKARRKLPEIPKEAETKERKTRKKRSKKKRPEDGSGEPTLFTFETQEVVVVETSPKFNAFDKTSPELDQKTHIPDETFEKIDMRIHNFNQNSSKIDQNPPIFEVTRKTPELKAKFAPTFSYEEPRVIIKEKDDNQPIESRQVTMTDAKEQIGSGHLAKPQSQEPISKQHHEILASEQPVTLMENTVPDEACSKPTGLEINEKTQSAENKIPKRQYSVEGAIEKLRRLSEEIHAEPQPTRTSLVKSSVESIVEEQPTEGLGVSVKGKKGQKRRSKKKKKKERPSTLEIEEVLYVSEPVRSREDSEKSSPRKRSPELQKLGDLSSEIELPRSSSPKKTTPSLTKNLFSFDETPESPVKDRRSPTKSPKSLTKSPKSPTKTPTSPHEGKSLTKTPTTPIESSLPSPSKSPRSPKKAPVTPDTPKLLPSPTKSAKSPTKTSRDLSTAVSPVKENSTQDSVDRNLTSAQPDDIQDSKPSKSRSETPTSPVKQSREKSPAKSQEARTDDMTGKRSFVSRRYKKSWLDESDDDNVSLLSDAASDDLEIDLKWLGSDSEDDDCLPRISKLKAASVQRTSSKAADMLAMWEKKAVEPANKSRASPSRKISSEVKVGNARAAWEVKTVKESRKEKNQEKEYKKEIEMERARVTNGDSSADDRSNSTSSTLSHNSKERRSSNDRKPRASEEIQDIFNERMSGKIQGAKALFENLIQSPVRSPSLVRSPRKTSEERSQVFESDESSPIVSRKSSIAENISQVSEDTEPDSVDQSPDIIEEAPKVDNMRALFENQAKQKQETRRHKPSNASSKEIPLPQKKAKTPSTIQKRVAARKKTRRSMTQPITSDDVMKAHDMVNEKSKAGDSDSEEEVLNFRDRLKFFSQLSTQGSRPRVKERAERRSTQPVKAFQVAKATEALKKVTPSIPENKIPSTVREEPRIKVPSDLPPHPQPTESSSRKNSTSVRRLSRKFSISSSSDNESLLSSSSTSTDDPEPKKKLLLSSGEDSDMSVEIAEIKSTGSIHQRMKLLQQNNTEERWKKKSQSREINSSVSERLNKLKSSNEKWKAGGGNTEFVNRAEKLSDRIARIKEDATTWKERAGKQNDAAQFTVQAKLAKREGKKIAVIPSPSIKRKVLPMIVPVKSVSEKEAKAEDDSTSMNQLSFVEKLANKGLEENVIKTTEVHTIEVPTIDNEEFDKFFAQNHEIMMNGDVKEHLIIDELPEIKESKMLSDLGRMKTSVQRTRRKPTSKNPVKALAARDDIKQSYDTARSNITKLEQQRIAQRGYGANFTAAALAGLAAKADLKSVSLRSTKNTPMPSNDDLRPFKDVMLLRAKGRRQVQTRLVEPCAASLCSDDAFLLITSNKLFGWFGEFCNVIERAKINEIADYIVIKGDLGCKVPSLTTIEEVTVSERHKEFWDLLGGYGEWDKTTTQGGDEQYEVDIESTIKTYKMIDSKLVPYEDAWGKFPKMSMLGSGDTFVFDFGAEMYIWQGKEVSFADRRLAVRLSRVIWEEGFDYTEHGFCPFHANELKGPRPEFGLFARVNENLETSLFQEKFEDWSNIYRETGENEAQLRESSRGKVITESKTKSSIGTEMEVCDVVKMVEETTTSAPLMVEGYDVSLGDGDVVDEDGRILEIVTSEVETYHVSESNVEKFSDSVLHRSNTYVVKWKYSVSSTGRFKNSKQNGTKSDSSNGRERVAFFSWAGADSGTNDKGASALIASNMDTDDAPIINMDEATAPPVFSRCFQGNLMVTNGKRGEKKGAYNWRLYQVRGNSNDSASLVEVLCECKSLRSSSSFVTYIPRDAKAIVWHGCRSPNNVREAAEAAVNKLSDRMPKCLPFRRNPTCLEISICEEGEEIDLFWEAVGIKRRERYECLLESEVVDRTTRAWKFTAESDSFISKELQPVENDNAFPLVQEQLKDIETPSIVLLDCMHGMFLWQNCNVESLTGSGKRRWDVIRRLAMETTLKYCEEHKREEAKLIEAGCEPKQFTNAFPSWKTAEKSLFDKALAIKPRLVRDILSTLTRLTYTIEELQSSELPDGVDVRHLETYLTNSDFEKLFEMTRKEFYEMPPWKQTKLRKSKKFF